MVEKPAESQRRRSTKHDGLGFAHNKEMAKIETAHNARVEKALGELSRNLALGREEALKRLTEHMLESGVQRQHAFEELEPGNFKNAGISGYFLSEKWKALLGK